ncbi:MAG: UDP-glucose--hexose-1-phosphate uridylyltransferase [Bacilli bacterium]|nr:UDP-glucose--hexose-1-phosphate uridylyltransferase [Bacilli bacterium]
MITKTIEQLLEYASFHLNMEEVDRIYLRNTLLRKLHLQEPYDGEIDKDYIHQLKVPDELLDELKKYVIDNNISEIPDLFLVEIMGDLTPLPSKVIEIFKQKYNQSPAKACDYLYDLSIKNNYIQKTAVDKNLYWKANFPNNFLEITINLSKPEKNNKDIKKLLTSVSSSYPKCLLCKENLGYVGRSNHPARENIRIIPLKLNGENFFMQYSPYVYYDEHCIVVADKHDFMKMGKDTFIKLSDFVDIFPNFMIGSNAELPIVGGSILNHEHFQGGRHRMPVMYAKDRYTFASNRFKECKISYLDWYNSVFVIKSNNKEQLIQCMTYIFEKYRTYNDEEIDLISKTDVIHSTVTPVLEKINGEYKAYLILRNNRCNEEHEDGIFHAHKEYHNIKKEGIGLIEAMGLFILPARLKRQCHEIEQLLVDETINIDEYINQHEGLDVHRTMIEQLTKKYGRKNSIGSAQEIVKEYINQTCKSILECTAIFKNDENGQKHLKDFVKYLAL